MTRIRLLHHLKIKQIKQCEHSSGCRGLGFLPDVRVITLQYSLSCSPCEMEERHSSLSLSKGCRRQRQTLQLISPAVGPQPLLNPQHYCSLWGPSSPGSLATGPLWRLPRSRQPRTFNTLASPAQAALIQLPTESITLSPKTLSPYFCTDHHCRSQRLLCLNVCPQGETVRQDC